MASAFFHLGSLLILFFGLTLAPPAPATAAAPVESLHMVPMRDGVRLSTNVFRPAEGPLPVVFARGPYGKLPATMARPFCDRGYILVSQDMRGRFDSEGSDAVVFCHDGWGKHQDGHDSIKWIASQAWCNGKIATWGGSALGITQNLLAPGAPAELRAQHVMVAFSDMYSQGAYQGGVWREALFGRWLKGNKFDPKSLETFLAHPRYDDFWTGLNAAAQAQRVNAAGVFWGGWYDIFLQGTIDSFTSIQSRGGPRARGKCRLIIGPWAHGTFTELTYPADKPPAAGDALRFFDYHLKEADNGVDRDAPVHYYVMGDPDDEDAPGNFWRSAQQWPPSASPTAYYFHADGQLSTFAPASSDGQRTYRYDPSDPVPTLGGQNLNLLKGPMDQRKIETRADVVVLTTAPLTEPVEVTGRIRAELCVSSDCPDTDFTVKLTDVYPDGRSMLVTDGIRRARHRKSFSRDDFLKPGKTYPLTVDLWSTSLIFNKGHRIRVAISSSNAPRFAPNPNSGKPSQADAAKRVATNSIHMSATQRSAVILPVLAVAKDAQP